VIIDYHLE